MVRVWEGMRRGFISVTGLRSVMLCRRSHPDGKRAGSNRESCGAAARDSSNSFEWAGPDGPAFWQLHHYSAKSTVSHVHHAHHSGQICAYLSTSWCLFLRGFMQLNQRNNYIVSIFCFSTSRCVPASTARCQHALRSWWVWDILSWFLSSSVWHHPNLMLPSYAICSGQTVWITPDDTVLLFHHIRTGAAQDLISFF